VSWCGPRRHTSPRRLTAGLHVDFAVLAPAPVFSLPPSSSSSLRRISSIEPGDFDGKIKFDQTRQLDGQSIAIPSSQLGKPIVGDSKGALFRRREMVDPQHRHLSKPEEFRGFDPAVAGNNLVFLVDHDRNDEAEALDALREPVDLLRRVRPRGAVRADLRG